MAGKMTIYKLVVLGDGGVGKVSLSLLFYGRYRNHLSSYWISLLYLLLLFQNSANAGI